MAPDLRDGGDVEVEAIIFRISKRSRLRVGRLPVVAGICRLQHVHPLGVGGHDAVFDAVVNHLDEVAGAGRAAMQISPFGGRPAFATGGERCQDRVEVPDGFVRPADHQAVAAVKAPDAAARPDVDEMDAGGADARARIDGVAVVGVAAVDDDVAGLKQGREPVHVFGNDPRWQHEPARARLLQEAGEMLDAVGTPRSFLDQLLDAVGVDVVDDAFMAGAQKPAHHVGAHPAKADHPDLHGTFPCWFVRSSF